MPCSPFKWFKALGVVVVVGGVGGGVWGIWVDFCWVCAVGLSEPLPHNSLLCGHIMDPISHFWKKVIFGISTFSLSVYA